MSWSDKGWFPRGFTGAEYRPTQHNIKGGYRAAAQSTNLMKLYRQWNKQRSRRYPYTGTHRYDTLY